MANLEDVIRDLRKKNSELALEVQSLKVLNTLKDKEKLELTKEVNELRLKISRLRSGGAALARKLDAGLQSTSKDALSHLVQASGAVARTMEMVKQYIQERQEFDSVSPRWSNIGSSGAEKVNKVPPLMLGGQSIQPVVSLSRTMLNNSSLTRSPNQNSGVTHRALPIHMLQDVHIPLTRIDAVETQANVLDPEENAEVDNSARDLGLEDNEEQAEAENEESHQMSSMDGLDESRGLDVEESAELDEEAESALENSQNPLEGPIWLLDDISSSKMEENRVLSRSNLAPDSTTPCESPAAPIRERFPDNTPGDIEAMPPCASLAFTPTVRRRKRTSPPPPLPLSSPRPMRKQSSRRVLKVEVAKMRPSDEEPGESGDSSPPKRAALQSPTELTATPASPGRNETKDGLYRPRFDAPSPNGAIDSGVIVCETVAQASTSNARISQRDSAREIRPLSRSASRASRLEYSNSAQSSASEQDTRIRRTRKQVSYKEKLLNRETVAQASTSNASISQRDSARESRPRSRSASRASRLEYSNSAQSSASEQDTRIRRTRKQVSYKEKLLNRETVAQASTSNASISQRDSARESHPRSRSASRASRLEYSNSAQSSASEQDTRIRRTRKQVSYKEKLLNRETVAQASTSNASISQRDSARESRPRSRSASRASRLEYSNSAQSSASEQDTRIRRTRKQVSYKEKLLNRETVAQASTSNASISQRDSARESRPRSRSASRASRLEYSNSAQSSASEQDTRIRRTRKQVNYKEQPLNRKLRR